MWSHSQEWWDCDLEGFTETDYIQSFGATTLTFNHIVVAFYQSHLHTFVQKSGVTEKLHCFVIWVTCLFRP